MEHSRLIVTACIALSLLTTVYGLKCVQCGYKPPTAKEVEEWKESAKNEDGAAAAKIAEMLYKVANDPGCPASLPEPTQCAATEKFCIKSEAEAGGKSVRYCYDVAIKGCMNKVCNYVCESDGCNGDKPVEGNSAEHVASKGKVLLIIMVTLSLVPLFKF